MKIKLKILKPLKNYLAGKVIHIEVDNKGMAIERYWRNRISDSRIDKCVEIMEHKGIKEKNKPEKEIRPAKKEEKPIKNYKTGSKSK